jgi:hypothetical protein
VREAEIGEVALRPVLLANTGVEVVEERYARWLNWRCIGVRDSFDEQPERRDWEGWSTYLEALTLGAAEFPHP